jgi:tetratricopeptide (TPR) repeat protein
LAGQYQFIHSLYRTVWNERIPVGLRRQLHLKIGLRKEQAYGQHSGEIAAELAVHFEAGRDFSRAVVYLRQAGRNAASRNAHREAVRLLSRGLRVLKQLAETPDRDQLELSLQLDLGEQLIMTKGWGGADVKQVFSRARDLSHQLEEPVQMLLSLVGLYTYHFSRAELKTAHRMAGQLLRLATGLSLDAVLLRAQMELGMCSLFMGTNSSAHDYLTHGLRLSQQFRGEATLLDPEVICLSLLSHMLWNLGYPDQAVQKSQAAIAAARKLAHPFSVTYSLQYAASVHWLRGEPQAAQEISQELFEVSQQYGFHRWSSWEAALQGWILVEAGQVRQGIERLQAGLEAYRSIGIEVLRPCLLAMLAQAYRSCQEGQEGQEAQDVQAGLQVLTDALGIVGKTGERWYEAELYRLKGELVRQKPVLSPVEGSKVKSEEEAEECFQQALDIARRQEAKSFELRAATSLSQLWWKRGKIEDAWQLLTEVYDWFTEGFETADLKAARQLLDEMQP